MGKTYKDNDNRYRDSYKKRRENFHGHRKERNELASLKYIY